MTTIPDKSLVVILDLLDKGNIRVAQQFPGDSSARQPVQVRCLADLIPIAAQARREIIRHDEQDIQTRLRRRQDACCVDGKDGQKGTDDFCDHRLKQHDESKFFRAG